MDKTNTQILLVEDNIAIAKGIIYALDNANFQVTLASTITEALKKIKQLRTSNNRYHVTRW